MKIYLNFKIENLFSKNETFRNIVCYEKPITKNKCINFEFLNYSRTFLSLEFSFQPRGVSHGGLRITVGLFGYEMVFDIYDKRHWDCENWTWEDYESDENVE